ncbi:MAG: hypothetical protein J6S67_25865 [Methanobrevibacter sp.]|nr:hypothetical protein [Methanobrevibacter sp.]
MSKDLTPEEIKKMKIARLRWLQKRYHQMDRDEKLNPHERAHLGVRAIEAQMMRDKLENGGL